MLNTASGIKTRPPQSALGLGGEIFSDQERFLIQATEEAIHNGIQLESWYQKNSPGFAWFPLEVKHESFRLPSRNEGFFGTLEINGQEQSVMGCRQEIELGTTGCVTASKCLQDFALRDFLSHSHWKYADGSPGGFTVQQSLYKTTDGKYGKFPEEAQKGCIDWRQLGAQYAWVLLTIDIHDFVMTFGPFHKRLREMVCVAPNPAFVHVVEKPSDRDLLEISVGYPFVDFAPVEHVFGFGPGKFGTAIKLFSFILSRENEIRVRLSFAAAPRCQKVLDFGKNLPDPIYGGTNLLEHLSRGHWHAGPIHDRLDAQMLALHCQVHQALIEGVATLLETTEVAGAMRLKPRAPDTQTIEQWNNEAEKPQ
jgi:hypothetical protein